MINSDRVTSVVVGLFALLYLVVGRDLALMEEFGPGPGLFPLILGLSLMVLSGIYYIRSGGSSGEGRSHPAIALRELPRPAGIMIAMVAAAALLDRLGFIVTISALIALVLLIFERYRPVAAIAYGVVVSIGFYLLFSSWLQVPLPHGILRGLPI